MAYPECHAAGGMTLFNAESDPRRLAFQFARYLFVAKALEGKRRVLEVGCAEGIGARIVRQHVKELVAIDIDEQSIKEARKLMSKKWPIGFYWGDILKAPLTGYDAVYCLDLFEHIKRENILLRNLRACAPVCIIGTPSLESQRYASEISRREHVNCVTKAGLRTAMLKYWSQVFVFGMNDSTLHCGHDAMTHYLLAVAVA